MPRDRRKTRRDCRWPHVAWPGHVDQRRSHNVIRCRRVATPDSAGGSCAPAGHQVPGEAAALRPTGAARADRQRRRSDPGHPVRVGLPPGHPADHRRTGGLARPGRAVAAGRPAARPRGGRIRAVLGAPHAVRPADHAGRGSDAGRPVRPPAEAAVSFHDRWSAGQLMSRAVSDLSTIRRFLGFGVVFLFVNLTAFVVGVGILLALSWQLGVIIAALAVPLVALCYLYESKYQVLARRSQDQVGDLATMVEESVLGIRILKAFGRSGHLSRRFLAQARELRATEMHKARVISALWAVIIAVPEVAFGLTLFLGIRQVADGGMSAGTLVAFFGVALGLRWPIDSIGWLLAMSNDAASASQRFFEVMDAPITITSPK